MISTLQKYFGMRFLTTLVAVLLGVFALIILLDYVEQMRRLGDDPKVSALLIAKISLFRVPQIGERILPFCVLIGAMSCFLGLSRRLELVVSRAAGMSAWQFTAPAVVVALGVGIIATTIYNPIAAVLQEKAKRMEAEISGNNAEGLQATVNGFWVSQRSDNGQSIINAAGSREQGVLLTKVSAFVFDQSNHFLERVESTTASLQSGHWRLEDARVYTPGAPPDEREFYLLATNLTPSRFEKPSRHPRRCRSGSFPISSTWPSAPASPRPAIGCNTRSLWRAVHAGGHGAAGRGFQPSVLPHGRRAENGPGRRGLGLPALHHVKADG
jgi:lipopolysaccharide export system permease protein